MDFAHRHIGPEDEQAKMLASVGYSSLDELTRPRCRAGLVRSLGAGPALRPLRGRGAGRAAPPGRPQPGARPMIGLGYYGTSPRR